eukprot:386589_1
MQQLIDVIWRRFIIFVGMGHFLENHEVKKSTNNQSKSKETFVIGAGFGRTATFSMKIALAKLGIRSSHFAELIKDKSKMHSIMDAANLKLRLRQKYQETHKNECISNHDLWSNMVLRKTDFNWNNIFKKNNNNFNATLDFPVACFYLDLIEFYKPNYKVILTVRDNKHKWYDSIRKTLKIGIQLQINKWLFRMLMYPTLQISQLCQGKMLLNTTANNFWNDEERCKNVYDEWIESVKKNVPKENLLIFNVKAGWNPLCTFLNVEVPNEPFPKSNQSKLAGKAIAKVGLVADICNVLIVAVIAVIVYYLWIWLQ